MRKLPVKISSLILALLLCFSDVFSIPARAEEAVSDDFQTISICNAGDLMILAESCHDEAWSRDKVVVLKNDISLEGSDFTAIPIFSGIFEGNGYTISGYTYSGTGYVTGLFRYVGKTATVRNLTVSAQINAEGDGYVTGIVAGINDGCISDCNAQGSVSGITVTGGLVGINGKDGLVTGCLNGAEVSGFYYAGGIVGRNYGVVQRCVNYGNVDATSEWVSENDERQVDFISEMTGDLSLVSYQSGVDIGGICGFSKGMILSSRNEATVGYERVGYNVGGICGRQSGIIYSCTNNGKVFGKKDVGGIVGQQEPYIEIDRSKSVSDSIARINALSRRAADNASGATPDIQNAIANLQVASGRAMDDADSMRGGISDYKLEEKDWASLIEKQAENAGREAADSVKDAYTEYLGDLDKYTEEEVINLINGMDEDEAAAEAEAAREEAREEAEREKQEAANQLNGDINGQISRWNSGIDNISNNAALLSSDLYEVKRQADALIAVSNAYSTLLTQDLMEINDQINATYDLIDDLINGVEAEGVKYLFSDMSESDIYASLDGRTISSVNTGYVSGDINVGGVAGSMSVDTENLESNVIIKFDLQTGEGYAISSVIYDCENNGLVKVRNSCGGGIAGNMEHGCVKESRGYGAVTSDDGEYIGGIAGSSKGSIISSYSLCTLSGGERIGGIAGYASSVKKCLAMPVFGEVNGVCGGIAGQIERDPDTESISDTNFYSNLYVSGGYYGIDDINYDGIAGEVGYGEVLLMEDVPKDFSDLKVTFECNGEALAVYHASYGDDVSKFELPDILDLGGSYGVWPDLTGLRVTGNLLIEADYISHVSVLKSEEEYPDSGRALALLQGEFRATDAITAKISDTVFEAPDNSAYTEVTVTDVAFIGYEDPSAERSYCLRLYAPYEECRVWKKTGDSWVEIPCSQEGSYVQINMDTPSATIAVTKTPDESLKHIGYGILGVALLAMVIIFGKLGKKAKKEIKEEISQ